MINNINKDVFTRQDIFAVAHHIYSEFRETNLRHLIENLLVDGTIVRVGRNQYRKAENSFSHKEYKNLYSNEGKKVMEEVTEQFPYIEIRIWELNWLNEFLNHLVANNRIFVEVERDGMEYVYSYLAENHRERVLLKPSEKELEYYSVDDGIIVDRLISEAPKGRDYPYETAIEKIIVDLFANKNLQTMISKGDYPDAIERIFAKYMVDQVKLFRYARRRNKHKEIADFLKKRTAIELLVEV